MIDNIGQSCDTSQLTEITLLDLSVEPKGNTPMQCFHFRPQTMADADDPTTRGVQIRCEMPPDKTMGTRDPDCFSFQPFPP